MFVLILVLRVGESIIREGPGYATALPPKSLPHTHTQNGYLENLLIPSEFWKITGFQGIHFVLSLES